jgi:hypothetical protein
MNPTRSAYPLPTSAFAIEALKERAPPNRMNQADG